MTDWKTLCAELIAIEDALSGGVATASNQGQALDGYSALANFRSVANRARAALAQQEGGGPTDEELMATMDEAVAAFPPRHPEAEKLCAVEYEIALQVRKARAVLARYGRPAPQPADGDVAELVAWLRELGAKRGGCFDVSTFCANLTRAADLLERQHFQPIPVSERLPLSGDCDAEGRCWWWHPSHPESGYLEGWMLRPAQWGSGRYDTDDCLVHTHWLPAHALPMPLPTTTETNDD